jgi:hypothetical protein
MAGSINTFFLKGGWARLPWKNSWFSLAVFSAAFSCSLLVFDFSGGKLPLPHGGGSGSSSSSSSGSSPGSGFPSMPFFSKPKPGSLTIDATPQGATVQIAGQPQQTVPANYPQINSGHYVVTVSAPGYETATKTVDVAASAQASLNFALDRSMGTLRLTTIPAHVTYSVKAVGAGDDTEPVSSGKTPQENLSVPAGDYQLVLDSPRDGSLNRQVTVSGHQTATQTIDLVQNDAANNASANVNKVLAGQASVSTLSNADKSEYAGALNKMFQEYVRVGAFPEAQQAIDTLNSIGQNTQTQTQHLSDIRNGYQQKISDEVKDLISQGQLGAARSKLKAAEDDVPDNVADQLNTEFTSSLGPYAQQIDSAVASANQGDPQAGFTTLQALAQQHPDDVTVALAMAHLLTKMPPDRDRISKQIDALKQFSADNLASVDATDLQQTEARLQGELTKFDTLEAAVDAEKKPSTGSSAEQIADLEREIARDRAAIAGASGVNNAVDSLTTGLFHTHVHVVNVSAKEDQISRDQKRINDLQNSQMTLQTGATAAQQNLDTFRNTVPW